MKEEAKAKELYLMFLLKLPFNKEVTTENEHGKWTYDSEELAKEQTLICVDELLKEIPMYTGNLNPRWEFYRKVRVIISQY